MNSTNGEPVWTILFREPEITGKTAMRMTPDGTLTRNTVHAAMFEDRHRALDIAAEIRQEFPQATVTVRRF